MSAGVDAMGVASRQTPALIVFVLLLMGAPAAGVAAGPEPTAAAGLIDPDCYPDAAAKADPALVEEPDGICPPDEPALPGDRPPPDPGSEPRPGSSPDSRAHPLDRHNRSP